MHVCRHPPGSVTKFGNAISLVCNTKIQNRPNPATQPAMISAGETKMATEAQRAANRENATRPRTLSEETKEALRTRATQHGLAAKHNINTVVRGESKQEFDTLLNDLLKEATLGTAQEIMLIKTQAASYWKLQRANRMESGALSGSLAAEEIKGAVPTDLKDQDLGGALALAIRGEAAWFETIRRYATSAERTFFRATRELAMIRKAGPQQPIGYDPQSAKPEETLKETKENTTDPPSEPEIGCDPQKPAFQHPGSKPRHELGGLSQFAFLAKLETMSESEAFEFLDKLTAPPVICVPSIGT
jgi:plasmid stability protein